MKKKLCCCGAAILVVLTCYNIYKDAAAFFEISVGQVLTVSIALLFAFYLTQRENDYRIKKEIYRRILESIQKICEDKACFAIKEKDDIKTVTMLKRSLNNYMSITKKYAAQMGVQSSVDKLVSHIEEYMELIGNHISDLEWLEKSEADLRRPLELANNEAIEIMIELYK